jgi:hypothetical protein
MSAKVWPGACAGSSARPGAGWMDCELRYAPLTALVEKTVEESAIG